MFGSLLLTIYLLFLITFLGLMSFSVYRVFMFCKNKELAGYSRRITFVIIAISVFAIFFSFLWIGQYKWDDNLKVWIPDKAQNFQIKNIGNNKTAK